MSTNRKASMAKRAREMAQKDGVKDREARRLERKARAEARAASGIVGPEIDDSPRPDLNLVDGEGGGDGGGGGDGDGTDATDAQDQPLPDSAG